MHLELLWVDPSRVPMAMMVRDSWRPTPFPGPAGRIPRDRNSAGRDCSDESRIHPNRKTKYRVKNWARYERDLVQ